MRIQHGPCVFCIYRTLIQQRLLVKFSCEIPTIYLPKRFTHCRSFVLYNKWLLQHQPHLHIVHQSYSLRRKMVHCTFVSTSTVLTTSSRRIAIHSHLSLIYQTHLTKLRSTQRQIFTILTIWFASLTMMNGRLPLGHVMNHLNSL